jgi:hypothetical protein
MLLGPEAKVGPAQKNQKLAQNTVQSANRTKSKDKTKQLNTNWPGPENKTQFEKNLTKNGQKWLKPARPIEDCMHQARAKAWATLLHDHLGQISVHSLSVIHHDRTVPCAHWIKKQSSPSAET